MTVAVAAETRISHSVARVSTAPVAAPRSLSRQVRDIGGRGLGKWSPPQGAGPPSGGGDGSSSLSEELGAVFDCSEMAEVGNWREGPMRSKVVRLEDVTDISYSRIPSSNFSSALSVEKDVIADCESEVHVTNDLLDSLSITDRYLEEAIELFERSGESEEQYWVAEDAAAATTKEATRRSEQTERMKEEARRNEKSETTKEATRRDKNIKTTKEATRRNK